MQKEVKGMDSLSARMTNEREPARHDSFTALPLSFRGKTKGKGNEDGSFALLRMTRNRGRKQGVMVSTGHYKALVLWKKSIYVLVAQRGTRGGAWVWWVLKI